MKSKPKEERSTLPQQVLMAPEGRECLRLGIDLPAYKQAVEEQLTAWIVADRLLGLSATYALHWAVHGEIRNWLRATFPGQRITAWPYGNWWTVYRHSYNPETREVVREDANLVIKS